MNFRQFEAPSWIARLGSFHAAARHLLDLSNGEIFAEIDNKA